MPYIKQEQRQAIISFGQIPQDAGEYISAIVDRSHIIGIRRQYIGSDTLCLMTTNGGDIPIQEKSFEEAIASFMS